MDGEFLMLRILILSMAALEKQPTPVMARRLSASADTEEPVELRTWSLFLCCYAVIAPPIPERKRAANILGDGSWDSEVPSRKVSI